MYCSILKIHLLLLNYRLQPELSNRICMKKNDCYIVPKGVEHKPIAEEEVSIMLFEPISTINTGETENERTVKDLERI